MKAKLQEYIVVRSYQGNLQFYAGRNEALGALRWADTSDDAMRFRKWDTALKIARAAGAVARKVKA